MFIGKIKKGVKNIGKKVGKASKIGRKALHHADKFANSSGLRKALNTAEDVAVAGEMLGIPEAGMARAGIEKAKQLRKDARHHIGHAKKIDEHLQRGDIRSAVMGTRDLINLARGAEDSNAPFINA